MINSNDLDALDSLPTREGGAIRRLGYNARIADGPRRGYATEFCRFLNSNAGRPWDKVYSEICSRTDKMARSARNEIELFVELKCYEENERIFDTRGYPIESWGRPQFYVKDGILRIAPKAPKWVHKERFKPKLGINYYEIGGDFFEIHFKLFPVIYPYKPSRRTEYDVLSKYLLTHHDCVVRYGGLISYKKRQISKREIRRLGLR
jgi:hypothetical protein